MKIEINSACANNKIYIIDFTGDDDYKVFESIYRDEFPLENRFSAPFQISNRGEMNDCFDQIDRECRNGALPIIIFEGHGSSSGLYLGEQKFYGWRAKCERTESFSDCYGWADLYYKMRTINISCANNLIVLFSACYGSAFLSKTPIISAPAPFYFGAGPTGSISGAALKSAYIDFFNLLIKDNDLNSAFKALITHKFKSFHSERFITKLFLLYYKNYCRGRAYQNRVEHLISQYRMSAPDLNQLSLASLRKFAKINIRDVDSAWARYRDSYLLGSDSRNSNRYNFVPSTHIPQLFSANIPSN